MAAMQNVIYGIRSKASGKIYVGQAQRLHDRLRRHLDLLKRRRHGNIHLQRAFNLRGWKDFKVEVLEHVEDIGKLTAREQYWIDKCKAATEGMNIVAVAEGPPMAGRNHTAKSRAKMSRFNAKPMKGKKHKRATLKLMRKLAKQRWRNSEYRKSCIASMRGVAKPKMDRRRKLQAAERASKAFVAVGPDGRKYQGVGLKKFCKENGLAYGSMVSAARGYCGLGKAKYAGRGRDRKAPGWQCWFKK